jgi:hypothetical protein
VVYVPKVAKILIIKVKIPSFFSLQCPDRLYGLLSPLFLGVKRPNREADYPPVTSVEA